MPRKAKGVHSSPETAGIQNLPEGYEEAHKDVDNYMAKLMPIWEHSFRQDYNGKWDEETLANEINEYFKYCFEAEVKPSKAGLCLWLNLSKTQFWEWEKFPDKYGFKSKLASRASIMIEDSYISRIEQYPTGNIFLLKTSHGHSEPTKIEVTNTTSTNPEEIADTIAKLGLDKDAE